MGLLVNGSWHDEWYDTTSTGGEFVRREAQFRNWITVDGTAGPTGGEGFKAEPQRYHLFVSLACPWAHRTLIFRTLKQLRDIIGVTIVDPKMLSQGWAFSDVSKDNPVSGIDYLHQLYSSVQPDYTGRVTVPVLWDKRRGTIVNNESSEIIRMLNSAFNQISGDREDFYPEALRQQINETNAFVYHNINNGVYRAGFATSQAAYEKAFNNLFGALDQLEDRLGKQRYLVGSRLTEADWRLFTTLIRFDSVYHGHFKTNLRRIEDYPNLANYLRELYQYPGVSETVNMDHIKTHYYMSQTTINPTQIVPLGPEIDYTRHHDRERLPADEPERVRP